MPETIWKYPIKALGDTVLYLPQGAVLMHAGNDPQGALCVWARLDPAVTRTRKILIGVVYTGDTIPENAAFLGTVYQGMLVLHIFVHAPRIIEPEDNGEAAETGPA